MSSLIVEISRIQNVLPHPNAERLELAHVKGWQCVVPKGKYAVGDLVTYVPPDSVMPVELSDRLGITKYLSNGRVRCARLRGEPSFGVIMDASGCKQHPGRRGREAGGRTAGPEGRPRGAQVHRRRLSAGQRVGHHRPVAD